MNNNLCDFKINPVPSHETHNVQDATKIQTYMTCPRLYFYQYILGFRKEEPIHALEFGRAWHEAKDVLFTDGYSIARIEKAYEAFLNSYRKTYGEQTDMDFHPKSPGNAQLALMEYVKEYAELDSFTVLYTEIGISVPIGSDRSLYGKMDSIVKDDVKLGKIVSYEHKTAGALWKWWADSWMMKFQIATYTHFLFSYYDPKEVYGVIVDGTVFRKGGNEHIRVPCELTLPYLDNWLYDTNQIFTKLEGDFNLLSEAKEEDIFMKAFPRCSESCVKYNRICDFHETCKNWHNPIQKLDMIPQGYKVEFWDPRKEHIKVNLKLGE